MADSGVYCFFDTFGIEDTEIFSLYEAVTGWKLTNKKWYNEIAPRILHLQRAMLLLGGPDAKWKPKLDDDNPPRFWKPLPTGPYKGKTVDRKKFEKARLKYYNVVGRDEDGVPRPETLRKLGLESVEAKLKKVGLTK
jgi:aldehyde:ferredoxin oxidoreductase